MQKVAGWTWHCNSLNTSLIEDFITHCSSRFAPGCSHALSSSIEASATSVVADTLWVIEGVIELTSCRYHHCD